MKRDIKIETIYPYPPEKVWRALTDSEALAAWLMPNDFKAVLGHKFNFRTKPRAGFDGVVHCEVLELDAPKRLVYTWRGGPLNTIVTFTLQAVPQGTKLELEHAGFEGLKGLMISFIMDKGWRKKILPLSLPKVLAVLEANSPLVPLGCE